MFTQYANLQSLHRVHAGEKPFQCEFCHKCFGRSSHLIRHHRIHTGEKPFQCEFCPKRFTQYAHRQSHHRVHTGEKPFQCEFCRKCFGRSGHLRRHLRIHTGDKPFLVSPPKYMCQWCGRSFQKSYLPEHFRIHQQIPHKCEICGKIYTTSNYLKKHIKRCHKH